MNGSRRVTVTIAGVLALAVASTAAPAVADETAPPQANLELAATWGNPTAGKTLLDVDIHNSGATTSERPWLVAGSPHVPAGSFQPGCLELQTFPGTNAPSLLPFGSTGCLLAPLAAGETRHLVVEVPSPASQGQRLATNYAVAVTGADGVVDARSFPKSFVGLQAPPSLTSVIVAPDQNPLRGFRVRLGVSKAGTAVIRLGLPGVVKPFIGAAVQRTVHFRAKGTRTVTLRAHGTTLRQLRRALRDGAWKAYVAVEFTPGDRWLPASFATYLTVSRR